MDIHFLEQGTGEKTAILMHGWSGSSKSLQKLQGHLADRGWHIYNLDLPGFGGTALPEKPYSLDDYVAAILDFMRLHEINKPILVGHSFGGKIALKLAAKHSDLILGLAIISASGIKPETTRKKNLLRKIAKTGRKISEMPFLGLFATPARKLFYKIVVREKDYYSSGALKETFVNIVEEHLDKLLPQIKVSVLLIWGTADLVTPLWMGEKMQSLIPGSTLQKVAGARHNLPLVNSEIVAEIIYNRFK